MSVPAGDVLDSSSSSAQIEKGAALLFNSTDADLYRLWVGEALPTYQAGADAGGPLRYRAHLDCDGCRYSSPQLPSCNVLYLQPQQLICVRWTGSSAISRCAIEARTHFRY